MVDSRHGAGGRRRALCEGPRLGCKGLAQTAPQPAGTTGERPDEGHGEFCRRRRAAHGRAHQTRKGARAPAGCQGSEEARKKENGSEEEKEDAMTENKPP